MGKLIVIEGTDGSGKSTQFQLLSEHLQQDKVNFKHIVFPRYDQESSALIRMYLGGQFGKKPKDVNAFAASSFYAVDRYASYKMDWGQDYESGSVILSDRYTTSNAVHQASKVPESEQEAFLTWLYDFEYDKLGLPRPDLTIYLDVPTEYTEQLMRNREAATGTHADIHEQDLTYLTTCRKTGKKAAAFYNWTVIQCVRDGKMRTIEDIHEEIFSHVAKLLED